MHHVGAVYFPSRAVHPLWTVVRNLSADFLNTNQFIAFINALQLFLKALSCIADCGAGYRRGSGSPGGGFCIARSDRVVGSNSCGHRQDNGGEDECTHQYFSHFALKAAVVSTDSTKFSRP